MKILTTPIPGLIIFEPKIFGDHRGFFVETYNQTRYREAGLDVEFVQDNLSYSQKGVLRGLHFQNPYGQGKLVSVIEGRIFDAAVDVRLGSPTFGKSFGIELDGISKKQFFVPPGFAHGFVVLSDVALFSYKCTEVYHPETEKCIRWDDPSLDINWPLREPILSEKDKKGSLLKDFPKDQLPIYKG
jgi:dTDP-4-dehydrorhamnose 3,5-epimerase